MTGTIVETGQSRPFPFLSPSSTRQMPCPSVSSCLAGRTEVGRVRSQAVSPSGWGLCVETPRTPPHSLGSCACLFCAVLCLCVWLPACVLLVCLRLGRSAGAPSPCGPSSVYAGAPKPALCPRVLALWFCLSVLLGAVASVCLCLCGCAVVPVSLFCPHVCLRVCLSVPLLVLCPPLSQGEGGLLCSSTNKLVSTCVFQLCDSEGV